MNMFRNLVAASVAAGALLAANAASADQYQRWVDVVNQGDAAIYSVYISDVGRPDWGPDLLGNGLIPAGYEQVVEPTINRGYCRFDVLVVYENGVEQQIDGVNLCEVTHIVTNEYDHLIIA